MYHTVLLIYKGHKGGSMQKLSLYVIHYVALNVCSLYRCIYCSSQDLSSKGSGSCMVILYILHQIHLDP